MVTTLPASTTTVSEAPAVRAFGRMVVVATAMSVLRRQALGFEQFYAGVEVAHYVGGFSSDSQQKLRIRWWKSGLRFSSVSGPAGSAGHSTGGRTAESVAHAQRSVVSAKSSEVFFQFSERIGFLQAK